MRDRTRWPGTITSALVLLALAACAPGRAAPAAQPTSAGGPASAQPTALQPLPALPALIEAAREEGQLTLVWSETAIGGTATAQRLGEGFNQYYGLNLPVQFTPGPSMPELATKTVQEYQASRRASTDILLGTELHIEAAMVGGALRPVDWLSWAPNIRNPELLAPEGVAVQIASTTPNITYNSSRVTGDMVPQTLQDLLKPQYKGRIASTPYAALFDELASPDLWGEQRTVDYVTKLADQASGLIRIGELERLVSGEFDLLAVNGNEYEPRKWQARGAPIGFVIPTDAPLILYRYMGVPKNAAHPAAAQLWVNYMLSPEAQGILYETTYADHYRLPGSKTASAIEKLQASGVNFFDIDVGFVQRNDTKELGRINGELQRILQKQ